MKLRHPEIIVLPTAHSTNAVMQKFISSHKIEDFQVIYAVEQTNGKGQGENIWISDPGKNLTFSMYFNGRNMKPEHVFFVNKSVAIAIVHYTKTFIKNYDVFIKWPNDIICSGGKIAGILIENIFQGDTLHCIIGIGYNLNQTTFPTFYDNNPISLSLITKKRYNILAQLKKLRGLIIEQLLRVRNNDFEAIASEYDQYLMFRNTKIMFEADGEKFEGIITGTDCWGRIEIIRNQHHEPEQFEHGRIRYLTQYF